MDLLASAGLVRLDVPDSSRALSTLKLRKWLCVFQFSDRGESLLLALCSRAHCVLLAISALQWCCGALAFSASRAVEIS